MAGHSWVIAGCGSEVLGCDWPGEPGDRASACTSPQRELVGFDLFPLCSFGPFGGLAICGLGFYGFYGFLGGRGLFCFAFIT